MEKELENNPFYSLIRDTTFKFLYRKEAGRKFYEKVIKYFLNIDLSEYELRDNELPSGGVLKDYRLDTLLVSRDGKHIINVEMNKKDSFTLNRNQIYLHRIMGNVGKKNSTYKELSEYVVEQINFNDFYFENKNVICNSIQLVDEANQVHIENFKIHNIYLPACKELCYNKIEKEIQLLCAKSLDEMKQIAGKDKELNGFVKEVELLNEEKFFGALYNIEEENERWNRTYEEIGFDKGKSAGVEEGIELGREVGREEGRAEGREEGRDAQNLEITKRMLEEKMDFELISKVTGLSLEKIKEMEKSSTM